VGDVYIEHLVKKKPDAKSMLAKLGISIAFGIVAGVLFILSLNNLPILLALVVAAVFVALYCVSFFNIEYEYIFTNGELDIDIIYSKSRRKRLFTGEIKSFEVMCHVSDSGHEHAFTRADVKKDYSSGDVKENTYKFFVNQKGKRYAIAFEPNDELLQAFRPYMGTSKLIIKK